MAGALNQAWSGQLSPEAALIEAENAANNALQAIQ